MEEYFIYRDIDPWFGSTHRTGKWFAFVDRDEVDSVWDKVVSTMRQRGLGPAVKVSTARDNPLQQYSQLSNGRTHMIIAYSRYYDDDEDRLRIAQALRTHCDLSDHTLYYKRDLETAMEVYGDDCWYSILHPGTDKEVMNGRLAG